MRAVAAFILTIVLPGSGHLLFRRYLRGVVLAVLFAAGLNAFLVAQFVAPLAATPALMALGLALAALIWAFSALDLALSCRSLHNATFQTQKDEILKAAQVAWLRDEFPEAERLLRELLARDERDIEAWVHLGKVLKALGRESEARICFRSALNLDGSTHWRWMLRQELGYADSAESSPAASH